MQAADIHEVIDILTSIVKEERGHPRGLFAALYRKVTLEVARGIDEGFFEDGPRMARFDTIFANRYFDALFRRRKRARTTRSWELAFDFHEALGGLVLQHILLGINAHINVDLGIAAGRTCPGPQIHELRGDFDRINDILSGMLEPTQDVLDEHSPAMRVLDWVGGRTDEKLMAFSVQRAREHAWRGAQRAAELEGDDDDLIRELDAVALKLGRTVAEPPGVLQSAVWVIDNFESNDWPSIVDDLSDMAPLDLPAPSSPEAVPSSRSPGPASSGGRRERAR